MTTAEHTTGQPVALFRLPLPLSGLTYVSQMVEALYGTGDTRVSFDGDAMRILAPVDGFGHRTSDPGDIEEPIRGDMLVTHYEARDDRVAVTIEDGSGAAAAIAEVMAQWFDLVDATNFVELVLQPQGEISPWVFTLQRRGGETPATLLAQARERIAGLEAQLAVSTECEATERHTDDPEGDTGG